MTTLIQLTKEGAPDLRTTVHIKREEPLALAEVCSINRLFFYFVPNCFISSMLFKYFQITVGVQTIEPPKEVRAPRKAYYTINAQDSPQIRYLKRAVKVSQETIKRQRLQVKRFRECNRRLTRKVAEMENIIKSLREQSTDLYNNI